MLLGADDVRRAIARIAHEIVERDRDLPHLALIGIRSRGDVLAARLREAIRTNEGVDVPLGLLDITGVVAEVVLDDAERPCLRVARIARSAKVTPALQRSSQLRAWISAWRKRP